MWTIEILDPIDKVDSFDINRKGLCLIEDSESITIFSDPFRSKPLYILTGCQKLQIFQDFQRFLENQSFDYQIDEVGFHETILFGTPLGTRTVYKNLRQLPAASRVHIDKLSGNFEFTRYWDFDLQEDRSIKSISDAAAQLNFHLSRIFAGWDFSSTYCMGLSGGMDSRLSLAYLSQRLDKANLILFTFGFDERILEYEFSRAISASLDMGPVIFHRLVSSHYKDALDYLPVQSVGHIAINHCHITSYLRSQCQSPKQHISNYYSDAVFGYATHLQKSIYKVGDDNYSRSLRTNLLIRDDVRAAIKADINMLLTEFDEGANYASANEYLYITERNPKFHLNLANVQSSIVPTLTPYADIGLLRYMVSVPLKYREQKVILDELFRMYFPAVSRTNVGEISSRFAPRFASAADWWSFRFLNAANGILRVGSGGKFQLLNKFQTEEHERLLFNTFRVELEAATDGFRKLGLLSDEAKQYYDQLPLRGNDTHSRFTLISLGKLIR
ncbi:MAG: hypothetical protein V9H69_14610 [Anaerolineae bacterium]|jgi:hypothetical protein